MSTEYTISVKRTCPICEKEIQVTKVRSRLIREKQDADFCCYYKGINPNYYTIWVCPHCGYAADERYFEMLTMPVKKKIREYVAEHKVAMPYTELRTFEEAENAFKLGIHFAEFIDAWPSRMAGLYLKFAWLYRAEGDKENETEMMKLAIAAYDKSLSTERYPIAQMTDTMVIYLIGVLNYKIGDRAKATQYLSRVIGDQNARISERTIYNMARDIWQEIRSADSNEQDSSVQK